MIAELRMVTAEEAAEILGVAVRTLTDWRYEGRGPAYHLYGGKGPGSCMVRYALADIQEWLACRRVVPAEKQVEIPPIRRMRKSKTR